MGERTDHASLAMLKFKGNIHLGVFRSDWPGPSSCSCDGNTFLFWCISNV
jgi:hypothetical protein